jgi:hypothetical protein
VLPVCVSACLLACLSLLCYLILSFISRFCLATNENTPVVVTLPIDNVEGDPPLLSLTSVPTQGTLYQYVHG